VINKKDSESSNSSNLSAKSLRTPNPGSTIHGSSKELAGTAAILMFFFRDLIINVDVARFSICTKHKKTLLASNLKNVSFRSPICGIKYIHIYSQTI